MPSILNPDYATITNVKGVEVEGVGVNGVWIKGVEVEGVGVSM
jgi:hypothetical protein